MLIMYNTSYEAVTQIFFTLYIGVTPLYNSRFRYGEQVGSFSTLLMCAGDETNVSSCNVTFLTSCSAFDYAGVRCSG